MIDLIAIRDYIKAFAQAHSYIQHNEAVRAYNRFVTYDFDESNTGDTGATAFPRLSLVANSRFGGYNGKMEQQGGQPLKATMQMEVSVVNTYPEGNYRRHDEVSNETLKVLTDLVSYLHANQKAQKCHPVLQHINFNSFQFFKTKLQTHGNAIGWALSFELGARIDSDFSGSMPPPLPMPPTPSIPTGSLAVWSGTRWEPLTQGEAGTLLKSNGVGNLPDWVDFEADETDPLFNAWLATNPIPVIPTNVSAFLNDVGYITEAPQDGKQYARQNATWNEVLSSGGTEIITRVLTANVTNTSSTPTEIIGLSFEADPNSTYIITGGLNIMFSNGIEAHAGMLIPSGTFSGTFIGKKNSSYDSMFSYIDVSSNMGSVQKSNREGHVGVYAVVTTGATGGTVKFRHVNYGAGGTVSTKAKSFIKAIKVV